MRGPGVDTLWVLLAGLAAVLAIASASYYLLELPFLRLKYRWGNTKPAQTYGHGVVPTVRWWQERR